ncbi:MAG: hypothetical protein ACRDRJ_08290, partial [Streptosporangiaceae bacterium]
GGPTARARALASARTRISVSAVTAWSDEDRIGPREAVFVGRVGDLAGHPVVAENGRAIAETMRSLRLLHQAVGRMVASPGGLDEEAAGDLEELLGSDVLSVLAETVIYRVLAVGSPTTVSAQTLYAALPVAGQPEEHTKQEAEDGA